MNRIDALRNIDEHPAVFLRFGKPGHVVIGVSGDEREIERSAWFDLPAWVPPPMKQLTMCAET